MAAMRRVFEVPAKWLRAGHWILWMRDEWEVQDVFWSKQDQAHLASVAHATKRPELVPFSPDEPVSLIAKLVSVPAAEVKAGDIVNFDGVWAVDNVEPGGPDDGEGWCWLHINNTRTLFGRGETIDRLDPDPKPATIGMGGRPITEDEMRVPTAGELAEAVERRAEMFVSGIGTVFLAAVDWRRGTVGQVRVVNHNTVEGGEWVGVDRVRVPPQQHTDSGKPTSFAGARALFAKELYAYYGVEPSDAQVVNWLKAANGQSPVSPGSLADLQSQPGVKNARNDGPGRAVVTMRYDATQEDMQALATWHRQFCAPEDELRIEREPDPLQTYVNEQLADPPANWLPQNWAAQILGLVESHRVIAGTSSLNERSLRWLKSEVELARSGALIPGVLGLATAPAVPRWWRGETTLQRTRMGKKRGTR